ncbi:MAG: hypothetical protein P1V51_21210 [Deltaproteobacteria bacterium]|nr:hypothetical protein [Deltaproteobacteria bacterium]
MPYCPACRSEFREGFDHCASCDRALVDELPDVSLEGIEAVEAAVRSGEAIIVARGSLQDVRRMQEVLADFRVPAVVTGDAASCTSGSCSATYDVAVHPDSVRDAQNALAANYQAMLVNEGVDPASVEGVVELESGGETQCPACETLFVPEDAASAECPDCGLFLGIPG